MSDDIEDFDFEPSEDDPVDVELYELRSCEYPKKPHYYAWCQYGDEKVGGMSQNRKVAEKNAERHRDKTGHSVLIKYRCK
ncbi:MAG: hypothetical protein AB3N13_05660 [Arenibacterium sp.]